MPKVVSHTKGLFKKHNRKCPLRGEAVDCDCPWWGGYKKTYKGLSDWTGKEVHPRRKSEAVTALNRLKAAIDNKTFNPEGETQPLGSAQSFAAFIQEFKTHYVEARGLKDTGLNDMLNVISAGLGHHALDALAGTPTLIERWLNAEQKKRKWTNSTWNRYYARLSRLCVLATKWKVNGVKRMAFNPMHDIERKVGSTQKLDVRLLEDVEERLLAACDKLNRSHEPHSQLLDWEKVCRIRARVAGGELQKDVAREFGISRGLCCEIVNDKIWNHEHYQQGTKGDEMRRRLEFAFDTGARRGEMMLIQLKHISFRPVPGYINGEAVDVFKIEVQSKGEKTTGVKEYLHAATPRVREALIKRRFELQHNPEAYVFGHPDGRYQKSFDRLTAELFKLAGLPFGRATGYVWHRTRHEFVSRIMENSGNPKVTQRLARHKDFRTTEGYTHAREADILAAAASLGRAREKRSEKDYATSTPARNSAIH